MAREIWIGPNRRALAFGSLLPLALIVAGALLCYLFHSVWWVVGISLIMLGTISVLLLIRVWFRPRVAYRTGFVEFFLRPGAPDAVPVEAVEAFFLGHGSAMLPAKINSRSEAITLVARLSRRAEEWSHIEVKPQLGRWCDGYVTIRGTWCEPLTVKLVERLNRRLYEVTHKNQTEKES